MANFNFNKVILGGRLTADPELRKTPNGTSVVSFTVAVNRRSKDAQTDFVACVAWRQTAEIICQYFRKGSSICVTGSLQSRSWEDQHGNKRVAWEVMCDEVNFVDSKSEAPGAPSPADPPADNFEDLSGDDDLPF